MTATAHYTILQLRPYPNRSEHVNYGLVVFYPEGGVRVYVAARLRKIRAMCPSINLSGLQEQEETIPDLVGNLGLEDALDILNAVNVLDNVQIESLGRFNYADNVDFERQVSRALASQVESPVVRRRSAGSRSRLFSDVKSQFKSLGILAEDKDSLPDHQVVENYSPDPSFDIKVEFALQNGLMRLAQTIDLRLDSNTQAKNSAYSKAYSLDLAGKSFEKSAIQTFAVVAGSDSDSGSKIIATLQKTTDHVLRWESNSDMERFFTEWAKASGKPLREVEWNPVH